MLCQQQANLQSSFGDSGSPIFTWDGYSFSVDVRGILHAGNGVTTMFSKWIHISLEVGDLTGGLDIAYGGGGGPGGGPK